MTNDRGETSNMADERPDIYNALLREWRDYVARVGVVIPPDEQL